MDGETAEFNILSSELNGVLNIPNKIDGVRIIGIKRGAFAMLVNFQSVVMPSSMITIEDWAFHACFDLKEVVIGENVTTIGDNAFYYCSVLQNVTLGENVTTIGDRAFYWCGLKSIVIPEKIMTIGRDAFYCQNSLRVINYTGTEKQWNAIEGINHIGISDSSTVNYNYGK